MTRPPREPTRVIAYHKPRGPITTHRDELGRETVYDWLLPQLPPPLSRVKWHAIGRLDASTTGLLLFTNDGALLSHCTQPGSHVGKEYRALCKGLLDEATLERLRTGVELSGGLGRSGPAEVHFEQRLTATTWITLRIEEGKNRQIRRMLLAVGSQVIRLHRTRVGSVPLDVEEDRWRLLTDREVAEGLGYLAAHE